MKDSAYDVILISLSWESKEFFSAGELRHPQRLRHKSILAWVTAMISSVREQTENGKMADLKCDYRGQADYVTAILPGKEWNPARPKNEDHIYVRAW